MANTSPILSGLRLRCGKCGEGKLFSGYLKLNTECPVCKRDMTSADTADGPAFFVGFGVLILLAPFLFLLPMSPLPAVAKILSFVVLCVVLIGLCMLLLPVAKAVLLNLQLHHNAEEVTAADIKNRR
ncbi:MAG: DUF983 domain-containing protein [Alphaproteobacteria bacterium]|uniref:DUF983 domain-containing protein n=1 Tax=Hyphomonas sp. TaxID=87 RepID=UPI001D8A3782|nr:DUF983 domain-containing protein [Alphaproteobacteria bacterium]MBU2085886.1 DUF983 domain-containing protein [Alphaproteobacteria bacterium]MBU2141547.1 DUF983 domain-containing protein [Alphaproteobacteria bacterium]MBU2195716.1 DUF983 domain-containing protein [Alphaproteobacteria bacterium]